MHGRLHHMEFPTGMLLQALERLKKGPETPLSYISPYVARYQHAPKRRGVTSVSIFRYQQSRLRLPTCP